MYGFLTAARKRLGFFRQLLPARLRRYLHDAALAQHAARLSDRRYLADQIPRLLASCGTQTLLFVGCRYYTRTYPELFAAYGITMWTTDIDPDTAIYGCKNRHITKDVCELTPLDFSAPFDAIILSGVIGHGLDAEHDIARAFVSLSSILKPDGILVVGWNSARSPDPSRAAIIDNMFCTLPLADGQSRVVFDDTDHCFDFLKKVTPGDASLPGSEQA